uniref:Uncharacterized protein n=1 Tax=Acrobeloides nanus TaxID=290746 RepID=A0A914D9Z9_9BILA
MTRYRYSFSSNATNVPFNDQNRANRVQLSSYRRITRGTPGKRSSPIVNPAARSSPYSIAAPRGGPSKRSAPSAQIFLKNGPTYHYSELLKTSYDEIHGDLIKVYSKTNPNPDDNVKEPRGVAYDEEMKKWIVADTGNNSIRLYDINSKIGDCVTGNLKKPTAIAVCQPGKTLAILDYEAIRLYDYRNQEFFAVVKIENCRGTYCGLLLHS